MADVDEMRPAMEKVVAALIACTPETWASAALHLTWEETGGPTWCVLTTISGPPESREPAFPSEDLDDSTDDLLQVFRKHRQLWKTVTLKVWTTPGGRWQYSTAFQYPADE